MEASCLVEEGESRLYASSEPDKSSLRYYMNTVLQYCTVGEATLYEGGGGGVGEG